MTRHDVTTEKTTDGAWLVSAIVDGALRHMRYYGYTKVQAVRAFLAEVSPARTEAYKP